MAGVILGGMCPGRGRQVAAHVRLAGVSGHRGRSTGGAGLAWRGAEAVPERGDDDPGVPGVHRHLAGRGYDGVRLASDELLRISTRGRGQLDHGRWRALPAEHWRM